MASPDQDVYMTLLTSDRYLPGALVVAHSLRDAGTTKKLAVMVTTDTVSADAMAELQKQFDFIIPADRVSSGNHANLHLMNRPDLHSTFTKINLWKQLQFRKIVYVDADMVALRAPDELFDLPHQFSAAPDIGWPDIFNSGLMVLTPNMGDYYALKAMAERGISFDGADQGLLNIHFKNTFNRLSFTYNVTPSAHYQYLPAFRHFQSSISMAHFIGQDKPWARGRDAHMGSTPYDQMVGTWWAVYDRHYRESVGATPGEIEPQTEGRQSIGSSANGASTVVQYHTKGEYQPVAHQPVAHQPVAHQPVTHQPEHRESEIFQPTAAEEHLHETTEISRDVEVAYVPPVQTNVETYHEQPKEPEIPYFAWDASKAPPPPDSKPEASNFPATHYEMSSDPTPFKAPERYPDPPTDMWYEVPKTPTYQKPAPIFPWEKDTPKPTRVFPDDDVATESFGSGLFADSAPSAEDARSSTPVTPTTPIIQLTPTDPWQSFTRANAWDEIPEIERYIGNLQKSRKGNIQVLQGYGSGTAQVSSPGSRRRSMKLTDFPTELERPSLPVTPAPIRRPTFWGNERDDEGKLPAAEGVPSQEDWDPVAELEKLARRQSVALADKLGRDDAPAREIPLRPLPYGSEGVISPTYVAQVPPSSGAKGSASGSTPRTTIEEPSYHGPGVMWEKDETFPIRETPAGATEEEKDVLET